MILRTIICAFVAFPSVSKAMSWLWLSPGDYLREATLIGILQVDQIHEAWTPEGILIQSATAKPEKVIYYQFSSDYPLPDKIVLYAIEQNAMMDGGRAFFGNALSLKKGRVFAILKMKGENKFIPFDRLSIQSLEKGEEVFWPRYPHKTNKVSIERIIADLKKAEQDAAANP